MKEIDFCPQAVTAEGPKIWGPTLEDLDGLDRFFNPHFIESGKIWGEGHASSNYQYFGQPYTFL